MNLMTYKDYIQGAVNGKITVGDYIKKAINRHSMDLERQMTDGFPYYFDENEGSRWVNFAHRCRHWKGSKAKERFILEPWQQFYFMMLFGWRREGGTRRFRSSYLEIGRKNGKTSMAALKGLGHILIDREPGAQVYIAATKEEQARIAFRDCQEIINATPDLREKFKIYVKSVACGNSFIKPLGSDSDTQDGFDPSYGIIDEYHAHPTSGMLNVLESGMGSRRSPLIDIITTAGFNREYPCYTEIRRSCISILNNITQDETQLALIYTLDESDDWEDPENWIKSNPNIGVSVNMDFLLDRYKKAKNEGGSKEVDFKTKNLNIWTDTQQTWIPDEQWTSCDLGQLGIEPGMECMAGLDLASTRDVCALVLFFPGEVHQILPFFFVPELTAKERVKKDGVNYDRWIREGFVIETPGDVTDYEYIRKKILELNERYPIRKLAYDRWNASQLIINLQSDGIDCFPFGQGYASMGAPTKELEKLVYSKQINHAGNPVLRWMCSNVLLKVDPAGNIKIDKGKSTEKVDGMVALVMALGSHMANPTESINYEIMMI